MDRVAPYGDDILVAIAAIAWVAAALAIVWGSGV